MASVKLKSINRNSESTPLSPFKSFEVKIDLPITLGRGPVIKCPDKKISRNHVMIDWDDEGVLVTSTHARPTFIVVNDEEKCLTQGQSAVLNNGDCFGLLKENFWYKVIVGSICSDDRVTESKQIQKESSPSVPLTESPTDTIEKKLVDAVKKEQNKSSPSLSLEESPLNKKENKPVETDKNKVSLILEKDHNVIKENGSPLIGDNIITESNKIEDSVDETDGKKDEIEDNLVETNSNPINNRKRALPPWMGAQAKNQKVNEKKSSEKIKNLNENNTKKRNISRPSKKGTSLSKFHECSDDDSDDHDSISPKKGTNKVRKKPTKNTKSKNQYHTVSQEVDSPDFEIKDNAPEGINKVNKKVDNKNANLHNVSDDSEVSPMKETKRVNQKQNNQSNDKNTNVQIVSADDKVSPKKQSNRENKKQIKQTKAKNQYHTVSQEFDNSDFETENNVSESEAISKNTKKANSTCVSDSEEGKSNKKEHDLSDDGGILDNDESSSSSPRKIKILPEGKKNTPRKSCQYGENCYRQNPKHRKEMSHPGDTDYVSHGSASDDDEDDDKPECEFGLNCYRKNPQHKKDFKHTKKPQPPRNVKKKAKRGDEEDDSDGSNEYDFDDSFLNDDSSDDYAPTPTSSGPDSEIEEADDTNRMLYEGKKFVRKRKR